VRIGVEPQESRLKIEGKRSWEKLKRKLGAVRNETKKEATLNCRFLLAIGGKEERRASVAKDKYVVYEGEIIIVNIHVNIRG